MSAALKTFVSFMLIAVLLAYPSMSSAEGKNQTTSKLGPYRSEGLGRVQLQNPAVIEAMARVPRHKFVPEDYVDDAYSDRALPIGSGQTISQPFIVALMTQEANVSSGARILEIGTGSGYQAAVLAELGADVYSIEIIPALADSARRRLKELGYEKVRVKAGDGWLGWEEHAPYDAILVTAAAPRPPAKLLQQLARNGVMLIPLEQPGSDGEILTRIRRDGDDFVTREIAAVRFVPMTGEVRQKRSE